MSCSPHSFSHSLVECTGTGGTFSVSGPELPFLNGECGTDQVSPIIDHREMVSGDAVRSVVAVRADATEPEKCLPLALVARSSKLPASFWWLAGDSARSIGYR